MVDVELDRGRVGVADKMLGSCRGRPAGQMSTPPPLVHQPDPGAGVARTSLTLSPRGVGVLGVPRTDARRCTGEGPGQRRRGEVGCQPQSTILSHNGARTDGGGRHHRLDQHLFPGRDVCATTNTRA